ncbi:MAG: single-stranded DNA-binding protein [Niameybacter sp.]
MGRLTRDPEVRYSQSANPVAVARYGLAVRKQFAKQGEPDVDFFNVVAFGKAGEFAEKYFKKGQMVAVTGRLQTNRWDKDGVTHTSTEIAIEEQHFAESKKSAESNASTSTGTSTPSDWPTSTMEEDDDLPF